MTKHVSGRLRTREERQELLGQMLSTRPEELKGRGGRLMVSPVAEGNMLLGAALHAAARLDKGMVLTGLEQRLVDMLRTVLADDDEVTAFGRQYYELREQTAVLPRAVTGRPLEDGWAFSDVVREANAARKEICALPMIRIADIGTLAADEDLISPAQQEAMSRFTGSVTVFTGPELAEPRHNGGRPPMPVHLKLSHFHCLKSSGDVAFGPQDEIYWAIASGADGSEKEHYKTGEFGGVVDGSVRWFNENQSLYVGGVSEYLSAHVECWEADDSDGGFYNMLIDGMRGLSNTMLDTCKELQSGPPNVDPDDDVEAWAALLHIAAELLAALLTWIRNDDDLVAEKTLGFTREALVRLAQSDTGEQQYTFDGGSVGKHILYVRGGAKRTATGWPGLKGTTFTSGVDAACAVPGSSQDVYLFRGNRYVRYNTSAESIAHHDPIATGWPGLRNTPFADGIDAASPVPGSSRDVYLFKGSRYVRYNTSAESIMHHDPIATGWPGLKGTTFTSGVDAACAVPGSSRDVYLFRGNRYVRYNTSAESIAHHDPIATGWPGLRNTPFADGIDAACNVPNSGTTLWLFKADRYLRYTV